MSLIKEQKPIEEFKKPRVEEQEKPWIYNIMGMIETTETAPTDNPTKFSQQFRNYNDGTNKRLYIYDRVNQSWSYVTLT